MCVFVGRVVTARFSNSLSYSHHFGIGATRRTNNSSAIDRVWGAISCGDSRRQVLTRRTPEPGWTVGFELACMGGGGVDIGRLMC